MVNMVIRCMFASHEQYNIIKTKSFNDIHFIMNDRRSSLHPKQVEDLTMLKYNKNTFNIILVYQVTLISFCFLLCLNVHVKQTNIE
jgi:hypothetical protein